MRLFVGGPCKVGKAAVAKSIAATLQNIKPDLPVKILEDPAEKAAQEKGFTFERMVIRRLYVRGPGPCLDMIRWALDRMEAYTDGVLIVNESPLALLGYCTYYGFLACLTIAQRNALIDRFIEIGLRGDARHVFIQPWEGHTDQISVSLNRVIVPFATLGGSRVQVVPAQKDFNSTVKAGALAGLQALDLAGGEGVWPKATQRITS